VHPNRYKTPLLAHHIREMSAAGVNLDGC
jgi:hypothetical protein